MRDYCLFIPYVNRPDLLARAVASVAKLGPVIVNNSDEPFNEASYTPPVPLTFAQTMNYGLGRAKARGAKYCLFLHSDAEAAPGVGEKLLERCRTEDTVGAKWGAIFTNYDALVALSVAACRAIGPWDVNLPWYFSDNDYYRRLRLAGYPTLESSLEVRHEPSQTLKADARLAYLNSKTFPLYRTYYEQKWGGPTGRERYAEPWDGSCPK
jgi:hypothetical protein